MKKTLMLAAALLLAASTASVAQKIGYTNVDYVLSQMPESKQIEADLKAYSGQLEAQLKSKTAEFQTKLEAYQKGGATMTELVKADKEKELQSLQSSIQDFQKSADQSLQQKQQQLLKPALDKLQKTIDDVAKENGYSYVLNSDAGYGTTPVLLHAPEDANISDLVLKKMGVTPKAPGAVTPAPQAASSAPMAPATPAPTGKGGKKKK
ncbi:MAG: OmpH family outer membrane protein [Hymenobacteraceae bacterium]|nr:OmpH family outer membrane protein [Hymenobacteraceae bacterium]